MGTTTRSWRALGTSVHVLVTRPALADTACAAVEAVLEAIDHACSRFRADSELRRIDARPGRPHVVSPLLAQAIEVVLGAAQLTDGAVDPTIGSALRLGVRRSGH